MRCEIWAQPAEAALFKVSHQRQLIFLRKSDCLGCAVLLSLVVCCFLLLSSFSHLSIKHVLALCVCLLSLQRRRRLFLRSNYDMRGFNANFYSLHFQLVNFPENASFKSYGVICLW